MKVVCIGNKGNPHHGKIYSLTIGKSYDAILVTNGYQMRNDKGFTSGYPYHLFRRLDDIRNEKIDNILYD